MSRLAWLDHDDDQRRQMLEVVKAFQQPGTLDELGIGSVRDTWSNLLFPGTSTLHTRARYLLFIPWLCQQLEEEGVRATRARSRLRQLEVRLIGALDAGDPGEGIIGVQAGASLNTLPSSIYWGALDRFGIRRFPGSRRQYLESLSGRAPRQSDSDSNAQVAGSWHAGLPPRPDGLLEEADFVLGRDEADYLVERIRSRAGDSLLAHLVTCEPVEAEDQGEPWKHPWCANAPEDRRRELEHARNFSEVIHGAAILYNLILAKKIAEIQAAGREVTVDEDKGGHYRSEWDGWCELMASRQADHDRWDRESFWQIVNNRVHGRLPGPTERFVRWWFERALSAQRATLADEEKARQRICHREKQTKGRLARTDNDQQLAAWGGASGADQLTFRWQQVSQIAGDIVRGRRGG